MYHTALLSDVAYCLALRDVSYCIVLRVVAKCLDLRDVLYRMAFGDVPYCLDASTSIELLFKQVKRLSGQKVPRQKYKALLHVDTIQPIQKLVWYYLFSNE